MQTIDTAFDENDLVRGLFEPCAAFAPGPERDSEVCAACGWLAAEHASEIAEVRTLPARRRPAATPKRLAS